MLANIRQNLNLDETTSSDFLFIIIIIIIFYILNIQVDFSQSVW